MHWFTAKFEALGDNAVAGVLDHLKLSIGLRTVTGCRAGMPCATFDLGAARNGMSLGWYGTFAAMTLWGGLVVAALVTFQVITRVVSGTTNPMLTKLGYFGCLYVLGAALAAGYLFGPDGGVSAAAELSVTMHRTWAPALTILAQILGLVVLERAQREPADDALPAVPVAVALAPEAAPRPAKISEPIPKLTTDRPVSGPSSPVPQGVRGKLSFATLSAEVTRGGIDARREDGTAKLVMWRDLVGVVARRLPPDYDGTTFVDLVSNAGSTLRILPWTRISGEPVEGDGEARARKLVAMAAERCPSAKLDPATRAFLDSKDAAQLPDLATLAAHDQRLA